MISLNNLSVFQMVILGLFIAVLLFGVLVFAGILPGFRQEPVGVAGKIVWWGTWDEPIIQPLVARLNTENLDKFSLTYVVKPAATLEAELTEALAVGSGPDLVSLPSSWVIADGNKFVPMPTEVMSPRQFEDSFINLAAVYQVPDGVLASPITFDPLVLYYNKDLLARAGLSRPPATWTQFKLDAEVLTRRDERDNILQSAAALGLFSNITHAKDILSLLFIQAGNPIVTAATNGWAVVLKEDLGIKPPPSPRAVEFFVQFADPASRTYSWNRSLPEAADNFVAGRSALYLGYGSEWADLTARNPHLSLGVALVPQRDETGTVTAGRLTGLAITRQAGGRATAAFAAASALSSPAAAGELTPQHGLAPARRDLLAERVTDPVRTIFYRSAVSARGWPDPAPAATTEIFRRLIEGVVAGRATAEQAVARAHQELVELLP